MQAQLNPAHEAEKNHGSDEGICQGQPQPPNPQSDLAKAIGVSEATISRLKSGSKMLDASHKSYEFATLIVRLYRSLDAIVGGDDTVAAQWLANNNTALNDCPINMIQGATGLIHVIDYLDSRRAVI